MTGASKIEFTSSVAAGIRQSALLLAAEQGASVTSSTNCKDCCAWGSTSLSVAAGVTVCGFAWPVTRATQFTSSGDRQAVGAVELRPAAEAASWIAHSVSPLAAPLAHSKLASRAFSDCRSVSGAVAAGWVVADWVATDCAVAAFART